MIRVFIIMHTNPLFRLGLRSVLERYQMEIGGESVQQEALQIVRYPCIELRELAD